LLLSDQCSDHNRFGGWDNTNLG